MHTWNEMCASISHIIHNIVCSANTTSLKWKPPLVEQFFKHATSTVSKEMHMCPNMCASSLRTKHFVEKALVSSIRFFSSREQCMFCKVMLHVWMNCFLFQVKLLVFQNAMYSAVFFVQPVPSWKKYCILSDSYTLSDWHVYMCIM